MIPECTQDIVIGAIAVFGRYNFPQKQEKWCCVKSSSFKRNCHALQSTGLAVISSSAFPASQQAFAPFDSAQGRLWTGAPCSRTFAYMG